MNTKVYILKPYKYGFIWGFTVMVKLKVSMTIDEDVFSAFRSYCQNNGMKISTKVEQMMRERIKNFPLRAFIK